MKQKDHNDSLKSLLKVCNEIKPGHTAAAPAAACLTYLSLGFFGTVALGQFSFSKKLSSFYFGKKV
jgi:hypothetical protein